MSTDLIINGSTVGRTGARLILNSLTLSMDSPDQITWTEINVSGGPGSWSQGDLITAVVDGTTRLIGQTVSAVPSPAGAGAINVTYTAFGLRFLLNNIWITASDGTGFMAWNLPATDPDFLSTNSGRTLGQILTQIFDQHSAALLAAGLSGPPSYDPTELAALTVVPNEPVVISGRLLDSCCDLLADWASKYVLYPDSSDGLIHVRNTLTLPPSTLTLDSDPVTLDDLSKDHAECFTAVKVRGRADIQGAYLSLAEHTLTAGWTHTEQLNWTISDFYSPKGAADQGNIVGMTATSLTVQSDSSSRTWALNFWNGIGAEVWAYDPAATGITFSEQRLITACTALSAGGTATLTVDPPFNNSGYTRYQIRGSRTAQSLVWRLLNIAPTWVAQHLARRFQHAVKWAPTDGAESLTWLPVGNVVFTSGGVTFETPWAFELVLYDGVTNGYLIGIEPLPKAYCSQSVLQAGGAGVPAPDDVKVLVPYSRGALSVRVPSVGWEGTANTVDQIERELPRDVSSWIDSNDAANMTLLGREILDSRKDTIIEGAMTWHGKASAWLTLGQSLNIARAGGSTGWETLAAPVRAVTLEYQRPYVEWVTRLQFSTRRRPFSGDRLYIHRGYGGQANQMRGGWGVMGTGWTAAAADTAGTAAGLFGAEAGTPFIPDVGGARSGEIGAAGYNRLISQLEAPMSSREYNAVIAGLEGGPGQTAAQKQRAEQAQRAEMVAATVYEDPAAAEAKLQRDLAAELGNPRITEAGG